ncbi:MAG: hypothetical protein ACAH95_12935 [Fimbriimonas sp.]
MDRSGYEQHETEQLRYIAQNTTDEERMQWLEDTLFFLWRNGLLKSLLPAPDEAEKPES